MPIISEEQSETREPYYKRLSPIVGEFGYTRGRADGTEYVDARVSAYDDLAVSGNIKVQFRQMARPNPKVAVFTFDSAEHLAELISDLQSVHERIAFSDVELSETEAPLDVDEAEFPASPEFLDVGVLPKL